MYVDLLEEAEEREKYRDLRDEQAFLFDDDLGFNAWQLSPMFSKDYKELIGKDAVLGYYTKDRRDFNHIEQHLHSAVYLTKATFKQFVGYLLITDKNPDGLRIEVTDLDQVLRFVPDDHKITAIKKLYDERPIFTKSVHNKLSRAYTRMALTRGIGGQASRELRSRYMEKRHTLKDETQRKGLFPSFKRPQNQHNEY